MTTATSGATEVRRGELVEHWPWLYKHTPDYRVSPIYFEIHTFEKPHYKSNDSHLDSLGLFIYSLIFWVSDAAWWLFHHIYSSNMNHPLQL